MGELLPGALALGGPFGTSGGGLEGPAAGRALASASSIAFLVAATDSANFSAGDFSFGFGLGAFFAGIGFGCGAEPESLVKYSGCSAFHFAASFAAFSSDWRSASLQFSWTRFHRALELIDPVE